MEDGEMRGEVDEILINFNFKHTLPQPLQSPPGNIHTEVKVLFNDL